MMDYLEELKLKRKFYVSEVDRYMPDKPFWTYNELKVCNESLYDVIVELDTLIEACERA